MATPEAYRGTGPFAFVSYARSDAERVYEQLNWLNGEGFRTYFDAGITAGHTFDRYLGPVRG